MEQYLPNTSWTLLLEASLVFLLVYLALRSLPVIVGAVGKGQVRNPRTIRILHRIRVVYEVVATVLLVVVFVGISPLTHGLIVCLVMLALWNPLRNYLSGKFLRQQTDIKAGQQIAFGGEEATVQRLTPLGVVLQYPRGTRHVPYRQLQHEGFTRISGANTSNFLELSLMSGDAEASTALAGHLLACPYLDWEHLPEVNYPQVGSANLRLKVLLLDEDYAPGFISLLGEWGFTQTN